MKYLLLLLFISLALGSRAAQSDSTAVIPSFASAVDTAVFPGLKNGLSPITRRIVSSRAYKMTSLGIPLVVGGIVIKNINNHFKGMRDDYMPAFRHQYDDYLQYAPMAVMYGLKAAGVKSRSSWGRMLTSDVFSAAVMAMAVNAVKYTVREKRPDGSADNSFPSGHTATAFMAATMMSKEYGGRSIWYSVGAYTAATATGLSRIANNKHWMGDVLVGAGIGVLSTEIGYWLADMIFKDRGITHFGQEETFDPMRRPSFMGLYMGFSMAPGSYRLPDGAQMIMGTGCAAGLEGAWFMSPYIGFGGQLAATGTPIYLNGRPVNNDDDLKSLSLSAGAYFSYPLLPMLSVGSKLLAGYVHYEPLEAMPGSPRIGMKNTFGLGTGVALHFRARQNFGFRLFLDYNLNTSPVVGDSQMIHMLTSGASANILF